MSKFTKILVTIVAVVVFLLLYSVLVGAIGEAAGPGLGIIGLVMFAGLVAWLRSIWKKKDENQK